MKGNQPLYPVERYVVIGEEKVLFGDGSHTLYVNGKYKDFIFIDRIDYANCMTLISISFSSSSDNTGIHSAISSSVILPFIINL